MALWLTVRGKLSHDIGLAGGVKMQGWSSHDIGLVESRYKADGVKMHV